MESPITIEDNAVFENTSYWLRKKWKKIEQGEHSFIAVSTSQVSSGVLGSISTIDTHDGPYSKCCFERDSNVPHCLLSLEVSPWR